MERFMREARAAARLSGHPNVVMIYDVGETDAVDSEPPRAFIVMEYLAGGTVADALRVDSVRRVHAVKWVHEAAAALDYAHSRGVLHRDIKPANSCSIAPGCCTWPTSGSPGWGPRTRSRRPVRCSAPPPISRPSAPSDDPPPTPATATRSPWRPTSCWSASGRSPPPTSPCRLASTWRTNRRPRASAIARSRRRWTRFWPAGWPSVPSDAGRPRKISPRRSRRPCPRWPRDRCAHPRQQWRSPARPGAPGERPR